MRNQKVAETTFMTPAWQQHIELITHLSQFTQNSLLVVAPKEGGKTTFLSYFLQLPTPSIRKVAIQAAKGLPVEDLLKQAVEGFNLSWEGVSATALQLQKAAKEAYRQHHITWVLLVDDAHLLSYEQLQTLFELVKFENDPKEQLHLILLGEPSLELRLFSPEFNNLVQGKIYSIELESWTLHDIKSFFAKHAEVLSLSADQIAFIFEQSHGFPGKVISHQKALIEEMTSTGENMESIIIKKRGFNPLMLSVCVGVLLGGVYLLFSGLPEEDGSVVIPINAAQMSENWSGEQQMQTLPDTLAKETVPAETIAAVSAPAESAPAESASAESAPAENVLAALPTPVEVKMPEVAEQAQIPVAAEQQKSNTVAKPAVAAKKALTAEEKYLLSTSPQHYTIQLLGGSKEANIKNFVHQHSIESATYCYRSKRSGKDWFVLVYGEYKSPQEAIAAMDNLPDSMKDGSVTPWVRELKGIHKEIQKLG